MADSGGLKLKIAPSCSRSASLQAHPWQEHAAFASVTAEKLHCYAKKGWVPGEEDICGVYSLLSMPRLAAVHAVRLLPPLLAGARL